MKLRRLPGRAILLVVLASSAVALAQHPKAPPAPRRPTAADAKAFVKRVNGDLDELDKRSFTAAWIQATYITDDTDRLLSGLREERMAYVGGAIREALRYRGLKLDADTDRMLHLLRTSQSLPAPNDAAKRSELASTSTKLESIFSRGKWCGADGKAKCKDLQELSEVLETSRKYPELVDAWVGWHGIAREMRPLFARNVELANEAAREIGFRDLGELWRSRYDMSPAEFEKETDRLWLQVKPLYDDLHCHVRAKLVERYGADKVPPEGPIPAHLLGNMWAQDWSYLYAMVRPFPGGPNLDVTPALEAKRYDEVKLVRLAEAFFVSLGLDPLPATFYERSLMARPRDREVDCWASAWEVNGPEDLRIKMCIRINEEDMRVLHHELGHNYYYMYARPLVNLFRNGAHDGFHEAIGDAIALSITPGYLKQLDLLRSVPNNDRGVRALVPTIALLEDRVNVQMKHALRNVAFLPFGRLVDQWRWDVFSGKTPPAAYNQAWWELRLRYQGVVPPVARSEADFDPGAKFHVPANYPYTAYFLAFILQFQFHRAMCQAAGQTGPLHTCSVFGSKEAGAKLRAMLALGASKPWPEALFAMTGERRMDAGALLEYYAPLHGWLKEQNKGRKCGW